MDFTLEQKLPKDFDGFAALYKSAAEHFDKPIPSESELQKRFKTAWAARELIASNPTELGVGFYINEDRDGQPLAFDVGEYTGEPVEPG